MTEEKIMQEEQTPPAQEPPKKKPQVGEIGENGYVVRKKRWGDRNDGRRLRTIPAMTKFMPYIMRDRCDALNTFADSFDLTRTDPFCRRKVKEGKSNFTLLHVILAAYVRAISQKPGINRFVVGRRIHARKTQLRQRCAEMIFQRLCCAFKGELLRLSLIDAAV